MAILKGPLNYAAEGFPTGIQLEFDLPVFTYTELSFTQLERTIIQREVNDHYKKTLPVNDPRYSLIVSDCEIIKESDLQKRLKYLLGLFANGDALTRMNLEDLSFVIPVQIFCQNTSLGWDQIEVIDLVMAGKGNNTTGAARTNVGTTYDFFFVNKLVYSKLVDLLNIGAFSNALLAAIFATTKKNASNGNYTIASNEYAKTLSGYLSTIYNQVAETQRKEYLDNLPQLVERIKDFDLNLLFEFPIAIPVTQANETTVKGDFAIDTNDPNSVSVDDLVFYDLSVSYLSGGIPKSRRFDWDLQTPVTGNQKVPFQWEMHDFIQDRITVKVTGVNGAPLWQKDFEADDMALQNLHIQIPLMRPNTLNSGGHLPSTTKKLRGKVIQTGQNNHDLKGLTVLIQAKKNGDTLWSILCAATTDKNGNFSFPYPYGDYEEAQALLSLIPNSPTSVAIVSNRPNESVSDDFLYLMVSDDVLAIHSEEDDCDCHSIQKAKRLPDQADLIESDEYTQDIGGGCVNLTTPNRTLREYAHQAIVRISDPNVANYTLEKKVDSVGNIFFNLSGGSKAIERGTVNLENPIRWQDAPDSKSNLSLYQAVTVATGHILHYKSVFKADGYSLGDLLYSLPLAPGQKKQIVVLDSSHSLMGAESQVVSQGESLSANLINDRNITDQLSGGIGESLSGKSDASTSGISAGLGAAGSMGAFGASLGVSGGYSNSNSSASQNSSRDISQFFGERLRQTIMQNASSYRQLNASVVTTVKEGQQYAVTTESVANHNHCHALTMLYFEVLRHYAIYQELSFVEECVFVPLLMTNFTRENIGKWKDVLASHLLPLPSSTYLQPAKFLFFGRQHPLLKAFDANDRIPDYANVEFPLGRYADEHMNEITGQLRLRIHIPRPKTRFDRILSFPVIKKTITSQGNVNVAGTISENIKDSVIGAIVPCAAKGPSIKYDTVSTDVLTRGAVFDMYMTLDANYETVPPAQCIRVNFDNIDMFDSPLGIFFHGDLSPTPMDFFAGMETEKALWASYAAILGMSVRELFKYFNNNVVADWDRIFNDSIAPMIVEKLVRETTISIVPLGSLDISAQEKYHGGNRVLTFNLQGATSHTRAEVDKIKINFASPLSGTQKDVFFNYVTFNIESISLNYTTNFSNGVLIRRTIGNDLRDGVPNIYTPLNHEEKRNPREEDKLLVRQLIQHLNSNLEYYNKILWYNLDPDRRFMLLDGFNIEIFSDFGNPIGYRSLASVVKNQLITVTGNSLVFPVAAGYRVSQSYIMESSSEEEGTPAQVTLLDHYKPLTPIPPYRISVPTRGVFMEAVQGSCDACEKVKPNSSQDWTKFDTEEPTSIAPVVTPTPTITDWKAAFKDFAAPLVNIQNAPDTPAPGAGLAGLSELLGKSGVFNDITGLQGNQQNAIRTYLSNQENVRAMAEMAKGLAMQQHNTENSQSITDSINQAADSGAITSDEQHSLTQQHLQQQIDGGERERTEARTQRERERPSLTEAAIDAASSGRTVTAQRTDTDGGLESVEISSPSESGTGGINIRHEVPTLQQPSSMLCWATAATMMMNWKTSSSSTIPNVLREAGLSLNPPNETHYTTMFDNNQGLPSAQKAEFITALRMVGEAPANYPLSQYVLWLQTYGPLWVTTDAASAQGEFSPHARILTGISGTNLDDTAHVMMTFNDPATGSTTTESFDAFILAFEQMVTDNSGNLFIQIVHFRDTIDVGEGRANARTWMGGVPSNMTTFKSSLVSRANSEYTYWHTGGSHTGSSWWETDTDAHVVDRLTDYWIAAFSTNAQGAATTQLTHSDATTNITNRSAWSAAFISCMVSSAGITNNNVFSHSIRHVDFIARAIRNKEQSVYGNPFWGYAIGDYAPAVGDIVGRSGHVNYGNVVNRNNWNVNRAESHTDIVVEVNSDHIIVMGGNLELDSIQTTKSGSSWNNNITAAQQVNVSVGKRKIYIDSNGKIDPTKTWEIFNNDSGSYESRVQFTGSQSEYLVVIKVRTDVNV